MFRKTLAAAAGTAAVFGGLAFASGVAHAATTPPTTVNATTHISNRPDNGHGTPPLWSYDTMDRTLTVTLDAPQPTTGVPAGDLAYTATISDKGSFTTVPGAGAPNSSVASTKIQGAVTGNLTGTYALTVVAPNTDTLTGVVPAAEDDQFSTTTAGFVSTGDWATQAFATKTGVVVNGGAYSWTYSTACESWTDSSTNGDGNLPADGNITGKTCPAPTPTPTPTPIKTYVPFVYGGHVVNVTEHSAVVGWSESVHGWPSDNHCVEVYIYGFDRPAGQAHVGFTCDNGNRANDLGYLRDLARGHGVSLFVRPAVGTYASHHPIPGTDARAHIWVVTLSA